MIRQWHYNGSCEAVLPRRREFAEMCARVCVYVYPLPDRASVRRKRLM